MTLAEAIVVVLNANTGVTGLVGAKFFPLKVPHATPAIQPPFIVYSVISALDENVLVTSDSDLLSNSQLQVDSYAKTYLGAQAVKDAVKVALGNLSVPAPGLSSWHISSHDLYDDEAELYRVMTMFSVWR